MAATKSASAVLTGQTSSTTSSAVSCATTYAQELYVEIVVVGSPTVGASFIVQWSPDGGTTYYNSQSYVADLTAASYYWTIQIPATATHVKQAYTAQTGGTSSTCTSQLGTVV